MSKSVFIVEDDPLYSEFLKKNLRSRYKLYSYETAEDAEKALKSITPDAIILDYALPGMSGIDLFEKLQGTPIGKSKIIITSGIDDGNLVLEFIKRGIRDYVIKDDNIIDSLVSVIEGEDDVYFDDEN